MANRTPLEWMRTIVFCSLTAIAGVALGVEQAIPLDVAPPATGTLVICGGGDVPDSVMLHFIELAGGADARIVFIPTAAEGADLEEIDEDLEFFRQQTLGSLTVFHTRSREKANDPEFARPLSDATGIWLGGGSQSLLTDVYLGTTAEELIRWVLNRGGVVGGISAGAAVMSPVMIRGGDLEPEVGQGFGLLPGTVIDQHFLKRNRQDRLLRVLKSHPNLVGIGIDEGTALIVRGHRLRVMGDSDVVTCLSAGDDGEAHVQRLRPGDEADLAVLIRAAMLRMQPTPETAPSTNQDAIVEPAVKPAAMPIHNPQAKAKTQPAPSGKSAAAPRQLVWDSRARRYVASPSLSRGQQLASGRSVQQPLKAPNASPRHIHGMPTGRYLPGSRVSRMRPATGVNRPLSRPAPGWHPQPVRIRWVEAPRPWPALAR